MENKINREQFLQSVYDSCDADRLALRKENNDLKSKLQEAEKEIQELRELKYQLREKFEKDCAAFKGEGIYNYVMNELLGAPDLNLDVHGK